MLTIGKPSRVIEERSLHIHQIQRFFNYITPSGPIHQQNFRQSCIRFQYVSYFRNYNRIKGQRKLKLVTKTFVNPFPPLSQKSIPMTLQSYWNMLLKSLKIILKRMIKYSYDKEKWEHYLIHVIIAVNSISKGLAQIVC